MSLLLFCSFCNFFLSFFSSKFQLKPKISWLPPIATDAMERLEHNPVVIHSSLSGASVQNVAQRRFCFFFLISSPFSCVPFFSSSGKNLARHRHTCAAAGFFIVIPPPPAPPPKFICLPLIVASHCHNTKLLTVGSEGLFFPTVTAILPSRPRLSGFESLPVCVLFLVCCWSAGQLGLCSPLGLDVSCRVSFVLGWD